MARIAVVEDKIENLDLMVYLLRAFGHETCVARDGAEGLALVEAELPDLVIMDLQMPGIDGYEALRVLKADPVLRAIPVVAVTAYAMVGDRDQVIAAGFDGYISKPIDVPEFIGTVKSLCGPRS